MKYFTDFKEDPMVMLLFLKNVQEIEILHWKDGKKEPNSLFRVYIKDKENLHLQRKQIFEEIKKNQQKNGKVNWEEIKNENIYQISIILEENNNIIDESVWLIKNSVSPVLAKLANDSKFEDLKLLPWTAVAMFIPSKTNNNNITLPIGKAFTVLPLPIETGK